MANLASADSYLEAARVDAWLVCDFRGSNPILSHLLGKRFFLTRRAMLLFTRSAKTRLLVSRVDHTQALASISGIEVDTYASWHELHAWLRKNLESSGAVAMEYSPRGELPAMSWVDGGALDLVRETGATVVSSADLFQQFAAKWTEANLASHHAAMAKLVNIKDQAFELVRERLSSRERCTEYEVQAFIVGEFDRLGLTTDDPPIVSVNANSGDPHYEPTAESSADIRPDDWLLIDLWCKEQHTDAVFADITWVGFVGAHVPQEQQSVFDIVARARDAVVDTLQARANDGDRVLGFELDQIARKIISDAGYADQFVHRTGHSLGPGESVHGLGGNLDDFETHDARPITSGLGFTIEPGIYLPTFGVRSEINVYMAPDGPIVTSPTQLTPITMDLG